MSKILDVRGMLCPIPVLKARKAMTGLALGETLTVLATDPMAPLDLRRYCQEAGQEFMSENRDGQEFRLIIRRR